MQKILYLITTSRIKLTKCMNPLLRSQALLGYGIWTFSQYQDTGTKEYIRSVCWWPSLPVVQHYKAAMSALLAANSIPTDPDYD